MNRYLERVVRFMRTNLKDIGGLFVLNLLLGSIWLSNWFQFRYSYPPGDDPVVHMALAQKIAELGNLSAQPFGYPPGFHLLLVLLHKVTRLPYEHILIFLPIIIVCVVIPILVYFLLRKSPFPQFALFGTTVFSLATGVFGDFYSGGQTVELVSIALLLLMAILLTSKQYLAAGIVLLALGFTHHLSYFPALLITAIVVAAYCIRRFVQRDPEIRILKLAVGAFLFGIASLFTWPYYTAIALGFVNHILPQTTSFAENGVISINTVNEARAYGLIRWSSLLQRWKYMNVFWVYSVFATCVFLIGTLVQKKRTTLATYTLYVFTVAWLLSLLAFALLTNVGGDRLIRQAAVPSSLVLALAFMYLVRAARGRIAKALLVTVSILTLCFRYVPLITVSNAANKTVRLNSDDQKAIAYLNAHTAQGDTIISPSIYAAWVSMYLTRSGVIQAIIRPRIANDPMQLEFWKILDESPRALITKHNVRYVYLGHPTIDVEYRDQTVQESTLLETGRWKKVFESGQVRIFERTTSE